MRLSLIVPVRNEAKFIRNTLRGLAIQDFPVNEWEILLVDGMSDDSTRDIVRELQAEMPNLHLYENPKRLSSSARNVGVRNASGEFIAIVDGHCQVRDPQFISKMVDAFEASGADTLGRPQPLRSDSPTPFQLAVGAARTSWLGHNPDSAIYSNEAKFVDADNVAVAYRREVFDRVGLFDESFDACEDVEFNTRVRLAGMNCYFTPAIGVEYQPRSSLRGLAYQMSRYGRGRARLAQKLFATVTLPSLVPPLWIVWLAAAMIGSVLWSPIAWALCFSVLLYSSVILLESRRLWQQDHSLPYRRLPIVFAAIHAGFAWGYLREMAASAPSWPTGFVRLALRQFGRV